MRNENDTIRTLLARFMAGETSLQEEQQLAQWFSTHPQTDDDLEEYRLMFAYFDAGMPRQKPRRYKRWLCTALAAAASLVLVFVIAGTGGQPDDAPLAQAPATATADTLSVPAQPATVADTLPTKDNSAGRYRRHRFAPAPPKVLLAEAVETHDAAHVSAPAKEPDCEDVQGTERRLTEAERQAICAIGNRQAEEALRQLETAQRQFLENAIDTLNRQMQLAGVDETDEEQDVY